MSDESKIDDGGPAFPRTANENDLRADLFSEVGMSLRDWFAGMALQGMHANDIDENPWESHSQMARQAYRSADAMLAERKRGET